MTFNKYQKEAKTTDVRPQTAEVNLRLVCSICGLIEELDEFEAVAVEKRAELVTIARLQEAPNDVEEALLSEASDILWYCADICTELDIAMVSLMNYPYGYQDYIHPAKILKKLYRDFNGVMPQHYQDALCGYMQFLVTSYLTQFVDVHDAMKYNVMKLRERYIRGVIHGDGDKR